MAIPAAPSQNAVVVESGPVAYEEPANEEDEDEEDEHCVSAVQLMGGTGMWSIFYISWRCIPFRPVVF